MCRLITAVFCLLFCCNVHVVPLSGFTVNDSDSLSKDLLQNYNKRTRGTADQTQPTYLALIFTVTNINNYDELTSLFSVVGFFEIAWTDDRMKWNMSQYNGVTNIILPQSDVWTPVLLLANGNGNKGLTTLGRDWLPVRYLPDGTAIWSAGDLFQTQCAANTEVFPYDKQTCHLNFIPWGYTTREIHFYLPSKECYTGIYTDNGEWRLLSTSLHVYELSDRMQMLQVSFTIERRPTFYIVNMLLPIAVMGVLNLFVFLLPPDSGERVGYSVTLLLAICVYLTIASENLPKTSHPSVSGLCVKLMIDMIISSFVMIFTIVGLWFYNRKNKGKVPACIAAVTKCLLCRPCRRSKGKIIPAEKDENHIVEDRPMYTRGKLPRIDIHDLQVPGDGDVSKQITWTDVGVASDVLFSAVTLIAFAFSHSVYFIYVVYIGPE